MIENVRNQIFDQFNCILTFLEQNRGKIDFVLKHVNRLRNCFEFMFFVRDTPMICQISIKLICISLHTSYFIYIAVICFVKT